MTSEQALGAAVRAWVDSKRPGDPIAADRAAKIAQATYRDGFSVSEACERARASLATRARRPPQQALGVGARSRIAS